MPVTWGRQGFPLIIWRGRIWPREFWGLGSLWSFPGHGTPRQNKESNRHRQVVKLQDDCILYTFFPGQKKHAYRILEMSSTGERHSAHRYLEDHALQNFKTHDPPNKKHPVENPQAPPCRHDNLLNGLQRTRFVVRMPRLLMSQQFMPRLPRVAEIPISIM